MSNLTGGTMIALRVVNALICMVLYWKSIVITFDFGRTLVSSIVFTLVASLLLMLGTIYFWKIAIVVIILIGLGFTTKASSGGGKIGIIIGAVILAVIIGVVGSHSRAKYSNETSDVVTSSSSYTTNTTKPARKNTGISQSSSVSSQSDSVNSISDNTSTNISTNSSSNAKIDLDNYNLGTYRITESDLDNISNEELRTVLNALYAYHGFQFTTDKYKKYFSSKQWYNPDNSDMEVCEVQFNAVESDNKTTLVNYETQKGWR